MGIELPVAHRLKLILYSIVPGISLYPNPFWFIAVRVVVMMMTTALQGITTARFSTSWAGAVLTLFFQHLLLLILKQGGQLIVQRRCYLNRRTGIFGLSDCG